MRIAFDATPLIFFIDREMGIDRNRVSASEPPDLPDRMRYFLECAQDRNWQIVVPLPALAEALVRAPHVARVQKLFADSPVFDLAGFENRAMVQLVELDRTAREAGDKRAGLGKHVAWQKIKMDRQILAIAMAQRCDRILTADPDVLTLADPLAIDGQHLYSIPARPDLALPLLEGQRQKMLEPPEKKG